MTRATAESSYEPLANIDVGRSSGRQKRLGVALQAAEDEEEVTESSARSLIPTAARVDDERFCFDVHKRDGQRMMTASRTPQGVM